MVSGQKIWSNVVSDDNNDYKVTTLWKTITISFQGGEIASDIITIQMLVNHFLYDIFFRWRVSNWIPWPPYDFQIGLNY